MPTVFGLLCFVSVVGGLTTRPPPRISALSHCKGIQVPDGTEIFDYQAALRHIEVNDLVLEHPDLRDLQPPDLVIRYPNNTVEVVKPAEHCPERDSVESSGAPNQWLAWYLTNFPVWQNGGTYFTSTFKVPQLPPTLGANLAIFPGLQPTYDPENYDFILQPVLSLGSWMDGGWAGTWGLNSVLCQSAGTCIYSKMFKAQPGESVNGTMTLTSTAPSYCWEVSTAGESTTAPGNSIKYCTTYMITFAFAALEHNPVGPIGSCQSLPPGAVTFANLELAPEPGVWQGALGNDAACGVAVDTFPTEDLVITF